MSRRILALILALSMSFGMLGANVYAADGSEQSAAEASAEASASEPEPLAVQEIDSGTCGENLTWVLDDDGTLTISGTGKMKDYNSNVHHTYRNSIKTVVINNGVTSIGDYAFYDCTSLASISIPDSVTSMGDAAFCNCDSLTNILIPDSVTSIGKWAFYSCDGLTSIAIPKSVKSIGKLAFSYRWDSRVKNYKPFSGFTFSGYLGTAAETYADENNIKLRILDKITISSVKWNKKKKIITVKWKKNTKGEGYQIELSKKKDFVSVAGVYDVKKNKKTSTTISGVSKGTWYVHMRIVKGKHASGWSKVKTVKVS